ncbi:MAG: hypothetical protein IJR72_03305 [Oscillospiraceae bacterium]|nr:hypothetical protein [Oscillospiraceae bacterium]
MSDCFAKLIIGITGLLIGSAELADGTRKRKTLSVAFGLVTALASIALLCVCAYNWLTGEDTELDDEEADADGDEAEESAEEVPAAAEAVKTAAEAVKTAAEAVKAAADTKAEEAAPAQEDAE